MRKLMILAILVVVALAIVDFTYDNSIKPDTVHDMANRNIVWYYAGK